jgi:hypothetical protein
LVVGLLLFLWLLSLSSVVAAVVEPLLMMAGQKTLQTKLPQEERGRQLNLLT